MKALKSKSIVQGDEAKSKFPEHIEEITMKALRGGTSQRSSRPRRDAKDVIRENLSPSAYFQTKPKIQTVGRCDLLCSKANEYGVSRSRIAHGCD